MAPPPCKRFLCAQVFPGARSFPGQRERGRSPSAAPPSPRSDIGGSFGDAHEIPDASSPGGEVFPDLACPPRRWSEADGNGAPLSRPASLSSLLPRSPEAPRAPRESPRPHRHWTEATGPSPRRRVLLACSLKAKLSTPFQNVARGARGNMRSQCSLFFWGGIYLISIACPMHGGIKTFQNIPLARSRLLVFFP